MKKVYNSHEVAYKKLKEKGAYSWNEMYSTKDGEIVDHIGIERTLFIEEILTKTWSPKTGKALEIGCGTGVFIDWISSKGFKGSGMDVSSTAIELAKQQNKKNRNVKFFEGDFCYSNTFEKEKFDLIVDGHCFHCIVEDEDRKLFLKKAYSLLNENGVFMLATMCSPVNKKGLLESNSKFKYQNHILYTPYNIELEGSKVFNGKLHMAQRKIDHWKTVLKLVKEAGFKIRMFKYSEDSIFGSIHIVATLK